MKISITQKIEWTDGAFVIVKRLTKQQEEALERSINSKYASEIKEAEEERASGNFINDEGSLVPGPKQKKVALLKGYERLYELVAGWEGIEDESGNPLPCDESTKYGIFGFMVQDVALMDRINAFLRGPLGNSKAGLTVPSNTSGMSDTAANASEKTESQPVTGEQAVNMSSNQNAA